MKRRGRAALRPPALAGTTADQRTTSRKAATSLGALRAASPSPVQTILPARSMMKAMGRTVPSLRSAPYCRRRCRRPAAAGTPGRGLPSASALHLVAAGVADADQLAAQSPQRVRGLAQLLQHLGGAGRLGRDEDQHREPVAAVLIEPDLAAVDGAESEGRRFAADAEVVSHVGNLLTVARAMPAREQEEVYQRTSGASRAPPRDRARPGSGRDRRRGAEAALRLLSGQPQATLSVAGYHRSAAVRALPPAATRAHRPREDHV